MYKFIIYTYIYIYSDTLRSAFGRDVGGVLVRPVTDNVAIHPRFGHSRCAGLSAAAISGVVVVVGMPCCLQYLVRTLGKFVVHDTL